MIRKILLATAVAALGTMPAMSEDFVIGAVNAKTGFMASYDAPFMQGVSMYQTEANARGGFLGKYPIELIERDDASDVQKSTVSTAEVMASEKMHAFITSALVPYAVSAGTQALRKDMLAVHTIASQPTIPARLGEGSFLVMMSDAHMGGVYAKFAAQDLKAKTAYLVTSQFDPYTDYLPRYFEEKFVEAGGSVVGNSEFAYDQQEFSTIIASIKALPEEPDVIVAMPFDNDFPVFINQLRAAGIKSAYLGPDVLDQPAVRGLGEVVEGVYYVTMAAPSSSPEAEAFVANYAATYGNEDSVYPAMVGYSFMRMLEKAIESAGTIDPLSVRKAFGELENVKTEIGEVTFKGFGALPNLPVHVMQIQGGEGVHIKSIKLEPSEIPSPRS
ncbi:ABC transporter substrate-binding protein [Maritalea porphyrae]|uniref:ABC transporter substrate-binding protein n=1 Tax=Maritalea porphyrae TaxID=880732 RepID=UPI0022B07BF6|nr:ABC transporter substrate-binding protein [Maritalea porphyrae]MCZ4271250.1 ABC transporter substrate-binding protein [Maritalea porphyrae]